MKAGPFVLLLAATIACHDPFNSYRVEITAEGYESPRGGSPAPVAFVENQVVSLVAHERSRQPFSDCDCGTVTSSDAKPQYFTWESDNPAVAKVLGPGRVQLFGVGKATLRVSTLNESARMQFRVVRPVSSVQVGLKTVDVAFNTAVWIRVVARDNLGALVPGVSVSEGTILLTPEDRDENFTNPVAAYSAAAGDSVAVYGLRPGTIRFVASLPILGAHRLRDTVTVVVR